MQDDAFSRATVLSVIIPAAQQLAAGRSGLLLRLYAQAAPVETHRSGPAVPPRSKRPWTRTHSRISLRRPKSGLSQVVSQFDFKDQARARLPDSDRAVARWLHVN